MLTVKEGTNLTGLEGNVLRILERRQVWRSAEVNRIGQHVHIVGTRPSKVERGYREIRVAKDAVDSSFSGELRRMAIAACDWPSNDFMSLQDAVGDPGLTPLEPDWSFIRDSTDKAIDAMFALAVKALNADKCPTRVYERGGLSSYSDSCGRTAKFESLEEKPWEQSFGHMRINRLYCKTHSPVVKEEKYAEERRINDAARNREAQSEIETVEHLKALMTSVQDGLNKGLSVDPNSEYLQRAVRDFPALLKAIKNVPSYYVDGRARPKSWLIDKATEAVFGKGGQ